MNFVACTLGVNAFALTGDRKYRDWVLEYAGAWRDRVNANGGNIPTNIGLDGIIGGELGGKWYGGTFGWNKDLAQYVTDSRVVQLDRRRGILRDESGVVLKWGVKPESIPDYLAVVGDSADGFPGLSGWGSKAAAVTFSQYLHLEDIPKDWRQ